MFSGEIYYYWKYVGFFISNNYYIYLEIYLEKIVTNDY